MHWTDLKKRIYFEDGSLRDIYVLGTTKTDWEKWVDLVNKKYRVEFWDAKTDLRTDKIDFATVKEYWESNGQREIVTATIILGSIEIKCHFFDDSEIENDIDPREFRTEDHKTYSVSERHFCYVGQRRCRDRREHKGFCIDKRKGR